MGDRDGDVDAEGLLRAAMLREQRATRAPSLVVAAARSGTPVRGTCVGMTDVERGVAATPDAAYRVGSITKTFTAAVVLGLAEHGVLALDAPVGNYLPGTPFAQVPLRMLLAHCGGLPREVPGDMWSSMRGPGPAELREAFAAVEPVARPGERWHYSNLGYAVLGQVVEAAAGTSCSELIWSLLWRPLGMTGTAWIRPEGAAVGYRVDPYADVVHREPDMDQGTVGVGGQAWSTVEDLLVWGNALAGGVPKVVSSAVVGTMHTLHVMVDPDGWTCGWGLGLILDRRESRVTAGHTGAMPGFVAGLSLDRRTRTVAVALSNTTHGVAVGRIATDLVYELAGQATAEGLSGPWVPAPSVPEHLVGVLGRWWSEADETVVVWRGGALRAWLASAPEAAGETVFEQVGSDRYRAVSGRLAGELLQVLRDTDGEVVGLEWATYPFTRSPR